MLLSVIFSMNLFIILQVCKPFEHSVCSVKKKKKKLSYGFTWTWENDETSFNFGLPNLLVTEKDQVVKNLSYNISWFYFPDSQQNIHFKMMSNVYLRKKCEANYIVCDSLLGEKIFLIKIDQISKTRWFEFEITWCCFNKTG